MSGWTNRREALWIVALAAGCIVLAGSFFLTLVRLEAGSWPLTLFTLLVGTPLIWRSMARDAVLNRLVFPVFAWQVCLITFHLFWMAPYYAASGMDAIGYHEAAAQTALPIRDGQWRDISWGMGNRAVVAPTAILYAIFGPSFAAMYVIASLLGLAGMIAFYKALAIWEAPRRARAYALIIFLLPSLGVWRSLYGKDCIVIFGLGLTALGYARWLQLSSASWLLRAAGGIAIVYLIRPYVGFVLLTSVVLTEIWRHGEYRGALFLRAAVSLALFVPLMSLTGSMAGEYVQIKSESVEGLLEAGVFNGKGNAIGGSVALNPDIHGLMDYLRFLPEALVRLMLRPFPWEAHNLNAWMATFENLFMILFVLKALRSLSRLAPNLRRHPFCLFSLLMTLQLIVVYSLLTNLGLISRMKAQILPFIFILLISTPRRGAAWRAMTPTAWNRAWPAWSAATRPARVS